MEIWKDTEYEGYQVSNLGNVRSKKKVLSQTDDKKGYKYAKVSGKRLSVHRLVAKAFIPNPLNKEQVNHINHVKYDNNVSNLEWSTQSENLKHAYDSGRMGHCDRILRNSKGQIYAIQRG